ncbi:zinc finger CCCH domain-containing protein ASCRUDRAFT_79498 [Ascoidea rubescens DSM 1968]|uniref:C3H1-type domain-containing protein n=1 Tax=Ascoidea rubescens DSM 1968 TaxID=1344418 RepID=A0A1D2VMP2_9ASCO|nr:hypothetical protein ASCRUDRAFT_79498 [Ascoidea rubescens DSM 1968]ODV62869.1 hypothetical protein ASCRUDRAFT_79498 [Ascoidea rubescens DSM 1968]
MSSSFSDKLNCSFYNKIGACRHGDRCSRKHLKPSHSSTIVCLNLYSNPGLNPTNTLSDKEMALHFNNFIQDIFIECVLLDCQIIDLVVCENSNDHLNGNIFIKFLNDSMALKIKNNFNSRWYNYKPIYCELSPVKYFKDSCCRQHELNNCSRGGLCNFMHSKKIDPELLNDLMLSQKKYFIQKKISNSDKL